MNDHILITGGAGFIGSTFVLQWVGSGGAAVTFDKLTYAGNRGNLASLDDEPRHVFVQGDIVDAGHVQRVLEEFRPRAIVHFAAESHVDRSIHGPAEFIRTNIEGTFQLLECTRAYWGSLTATQQQDFRFIHVSTDEVYGSLGPHDPAFTEETPYAPNSPYAASKAASDHLVRAYHETYRLPTITTNCSNNYGPRQFPEKLIPLVILNACKQERLPVYGDGLNVRDWLYVGDHCDAIAAVLARGRVGETYNIGGRQEMSNIEVVRAVCSLMDELRPCADGPHERLIQFVKDRPGHDRRYAMNISKIERELGWRPRETFMTGLRKTVQWYLDNPAWVESVTSGAYRDWMRRHYVA
jgi:dTDP-glucose 4,6-dehydratase